MAFVGCFSGPLPPLIMKEISCLVPPTLTKPDLDMMHFLFDEYLDSSISNNHNRDTLSFKARAGIVATTMG